MQRQRGQSEMHEHRAEREEQHGVLLQFAFQSHPLVHDERQTEGRDAQPVENGRGKGRAADRAADLHHHGQSDEEQHVNAD